MLMLKSQYNIGPAIEATQSTKGELNMKKRISLILILMLVLMMSLTGCAAEKDKLLGTWKGSFDLSDAINTEITAQDEELGKYLTLEGFTIEITVTFNKDDTYSMSADNSQADVLMESLLTQMEEGLKLYFEDMLKAEGINMSIDEFLAAMGISISDLLKESLPDNLMTEMLTELERSGKFAVDDGKIFLSESLDSEVDKSIYEIYTIEGNTLTIDAGTALSEDELNIYPMVFQKVK